MAIRGEISRHENGPVRNDCPAGADAAHAPDHGEGSALTAPQLRTVHDSTTVGIIVFDVEQCILDANPAVAEMLGLDLEAIRGRPLDVCHHGLTRDDGSPLPPAERPLALALHTRQPARDHVLGLLRLDGRRRWLRLEAVPVLNDGGTVRQVVATCIDVTRLKEAEERLALQYAITSIAATAATPQSAIPRFLRAWCERLGWDVGIFWRLDHEAGLLRYGRAWHGSAVTSRSLEARSRRLALPRGMELPGRAWESRAPLWVPDVAAEPAFSRAAQAAREGLQSAFCFPIMVGQTCYGVVECFGRAAPDPDHSLAQTALTISAQIGLFLERKQAEEALRHRGLHDALTDLPNRTLLHDRLWQAIAAAQRNSGALALLLLDLDRFKDVNDTLGHHHGDLLLQQLGARLQAVVRRSDTVARLGGDEFAVLLPGANATGAPWVAQKILTALAAPFTLEGQTLEAGASIGIALYPDHGAEAAALLRQADVAMYAAKRTGGGFAIYDPSRDQHSSNRLAMEGELREAIAQDRLTLHYQPQVDIESGRVYAVEALARWPHPQRGLIPPDQFIPLSEHTGLIAPLNRWVLDTALHQCRLWQRAGLDLKVAVNLSMGTVHDPQLPDTVAWLLRRYGIADSRLTLEMTESVLMADLPRAIEVLTRLAKLGLHISIDDFGTGYSSLGYLSQLPLHEIKIDKSFVTNMVLNDHDASILSFTIGLGHSLGLRVVAEGVEQPETWELLAALGCDSAQGYYLSRPLPVADLEQWLASSPWGISAADDMAV